jgi:hypothetical protein
MCPPCSSNDIPATPLTSDDDEWPGSALPQAPALSCSSAKPLQRSEYRSTLLVIGKSTTTASYATALEFTLANPEGRELGQVESLAVPDAPFPRFH